MPGAMARDRTMPTKHSRPLSVVRPASPSVSGPPVSALDGRRVGAHARISKEALLHLHRTLMLVHRFRALCTLRAEANEIADLLQTLITTWRDAFHVVDQLYPASQDDIAGDISDERAACLHELESLLRGLRLGTPAASRDLNHALDGLLVQCVVFEGIVTGKLARRSAGLP